MRNRICRVLQAVQNKPCVASKGQSRFACSVLCFSALAAWKVHLHGFRGTVTPVLCKDVVRLFMRRRYRCATCGTAFHATSSDVQLHFLSLFGESVLCAQKEGRRSGCWHTLEFVVHTYGKLRKAITAAALRTQYTETVLYLTLAAIFQFSQSRAALCH